MAPNDYVDTAGSSLDVKLTAISRFNNWDSRECAVEQANADQWKAETKAYVQTCGPIPKVIHQIWIGPKEPPCVWLDSWRGGYLKDYPEWGYQLWTDEEVAGMKMLNRNFYDQEKMYQCKADLLRLEILYEHGGVYIDADMVSLKKNLAPIIESGKDTGFIIAYEPDTKDKPYSVIGNSLIACTPRHPIIKMLMLYIRSVYPHKRPYHGVEWVTGPLAYTKCIAHTNMPMTVPPVHYFYPKFHYVPNPSAINLSSFPNSFCFQFGYTCSGLEGWVKNNNKCKRPFKCQHHSKKAQEYPLGKLMPFPAAATEAEIEAAASRPIPPVIHQLVLQASDSDKPTRWMNTWQVDFVKAHPGFSARTWKFSDLKLGQYFCANLYSATADPPMDATAVKLLGLELLYKFGGYIVPQGIVWSGKLGVLSTDLKGFFEDGVIMGCCANSPVVLGLIQSFYDGQCAPKPISEGVELGLSYPMVVGYGENVPAQATFPDWTRFLGAEVIYDLCATAATDGPMVSWAYDSQVRVHRVSDKFEGITSIRSSSKRLCAVWDRDLFTYNEIRDQLPGFVAQLDAENSDWEVMLLGIEWETGQEWFDLYRVPNPFRPPTVKYVGVVCNKGAAVHLPDAEDAESFVQGLLNKGYVRLYCGCKKYSQTKEQADILRCVPALKQAFRVLANHEPPFESSREEMYGRNWKGFVDHRLSFEMNYDGDGKVSYRAWNDDGGLNSEARITVFGSGGTADYIKVFYDHRLVFEANNKKF
mmetsp:Transcript_8217/g.14059  ORF Transcript_8217/g.14059 Transcript_8217/m.14059 type:complete len:755 (+) Transcript_8217:168-2432(+)